jgi:low affinity Fe/Cu permease
LSFDRFADWIAEVVATAWFFAFCVALVVVWVPSILVIRSVDTWQLIINTATTIVTFLLVALLHNTSHRFEQETVARLERLERGDDG